MASIGGGAALGRDDGASTGVGAGFVVVKRAPSAATGDAEGADVGCWGCGAALVGTTTEAAVPAFVGGVGKGNATALPGVVVFLERGAECNEALDVGEVFEDVAKFSVPAEGCFTKVDGARGASV
ncbi:hypothetical protein CCP2SC5_50003 [Azospirillaceae bacterium]